MGAHDSDGAGGDLIQIQQNRTRAFAQGHRAGSIRHKVRSWLLEKTIGVGLQRWETVQSRLSGTVSVYTWAKEFDREDLNMHSGVFCLKPEVFTLQKPEVFTLRRQAS
jgi:hypothetical protein